MPASPRGYHTLTEYRDCPRRFFLHRVCGLEPQKDRSSLITGRLIHEFQEGVFNLMKNKREVDGEALLRELDAVFDTNREAFYAEEDFIKARREVLGGCSQWLRTFYEQDSLNLIPIQAEWLLKTKVGGGYDLTGRLDRVYWSKEDNEFVIMDTKTTRWGAYTVEKAFALDDQATVYERLLRTAGPINIPDVGVRDPMKCTIAVIPDIMDLKPKTPSCLRTVVIRKNNVHWIQFSVGAYRTLQDIQESISGYNSYLADNGQADPFYYFPCHASTCSKFGCDYADLCKSEEIDPSTEALPGFIKIVPNTEVFFVKEIDISSSSPYTDEGGVADV